MPALDLSLAAFGRAPEPLVLLLAALVLDALVPTRLRPKAAQGAIIALARATGALAGKLDRPGRSAGKRLARGTLLAVFLAAAAAAAGWAITLLAAAPFGWLVMLAAMLVLVVQRRPVDDVRGIAGALAKGDAGAAAAAVLGPRAAGLDDPGLARVCVQYLGERFSEGLVAGVFWFALLGLPGLAAYRALNIAARVLPARMGDFAQTPGRLHEAVVFLPALLAGLLISIAAAIAPSRGMTAAFAAMTAVQHARAVAWPVAALSGALGVRLSGTDVGAPAPSARSPARRQDMIATGSRTAAASDLNRAAYLYAVAALLNLALLALVAIGRFVA